MPWHRVAIVLVMLTLAGCTENPSMPSVPSAPETRATTAEPPVASTPAPASVKSAGLGSWPGRQLWSVELGSQDFAFGGGAIVVSSGGTQDRLVALDPSSGRALWDKHEPRLDLFALGGGHIFLASNPSSYAALRLTDGSEAWTFAAEDFAAHPPVFAGGRVFVSNIQEDDSFLVRGLDAQTGRVLWARQPAAQLSGTESHVVWANETLAVVSLQDGTAAAYDAARGDLRWFSQIAPTVQKTMLRAIGASEAALYFYDAPFLAKESRVIAVDITTGIPLWATTVAPSAFIAQAVEIVGDVIVVPAHGKVEAVNLSDGVSRWSYWTGVGSNESFGYANNDTKVATADGTVYGTQWDAAARRAVTFALNVSTGEPLWRVEDIGSLAPPAVVGDRLFLRNATGPTIVAFDTASGAWRTHTVPNERTVNVASAGDVLVARGDSRLYAFAP